MNYLKHLLISWSNGDIIKIGSKFTKQSYKYRGLDSKNRIVLSYKTKCIIIDLYQYTNLVNMSLYRRRYHRISYA